MATSKESVSAVPHECFYRCGFPRHATNLTAALTKASLTDEKVASYLKWCCVRFWQALDSDGRTLIHVAASKGRLKLLTFLLGHQNVNINARDQESLYTALHRSLFYGQLHCAVRLIQVPFLYKKFFLHVAEGINKLYGKHFCFLAGSKSSTNRPGRFNSFGPRHERQTKNSGI